MEVKLRTLLLASLVIGLAACGGGGGDTPAPAPTPKASTPKKKGFTFHPTPPHAQHLAYDARDQAQVSANGHRDGAGVFVFAVKDGAKYVLLARRASWLSQPGSWGVFGGSVETSDQDATGSLSYARAAEHELYEESVSVYHDTDAIALRECRSHLKRFRSGSRFRTFFSKQDYLPAETFNEGYRYAVSWNLPRKFQENDQFLWVLLDDLKAAGAARTQRATFTDAAGTAHTLALFNGFYHALIESGYLAELDNL